MTYSNLYARLYTAIQNVVKVLKSILSFNSSVYYLVIIAIFQILAWLQAIFIFRNLTGDFLVLHYNVDFGIDLVAEPSRIFQWPLFALIIFFINSIILAVVGKNKDFKLFLHLLLIATSLFGLLLNLALLSIYLINFR